jgi:hypothetical protein
VGDTVHPALPNIARCRKKYKLRAGRWRGRAPS